VPSLPPPLNPALILAWYAGVYATAGCPSVRPCLSVCPVDRQQQRRAAGLLVQGWKKSVSGFYVFKNLNSGKVEQN